MARLLSSLLLVALASAATCTTPPPPPPSKNVPTAHTVNGTYMGLSLPGFSQEAFYGIPFARPPLGDLRLRHPVPYDESWRGARPATTRSVSCPGFDKPFPQGFADGLTMGEDCLTLDVVRPAGARPGDDLPVFVWIYGGGFKAGGSADPRYNASFLVRNAAEMGKPILAVMPNYRTMGFGMLASMEVAAAGVGNIALHDQRLALRWIRENIRAFGGDPGKVTIAGESAGGTSVGYHMVANKGNNEGLFRGAIMESSSLLGAPLNTVETLSHQYQGFYDNITAAVGCDKAPDSLSCLRTVPYDRLYGAMVGFQFKPYIDGTFLSQLPSESIRRGEIADVAVLMGSNTDEGTAVFFTPRGQLNTDADVRTWVAGMGVLGLGNATVERVLALYPDDPAFGCPFETGPQRFEDQGRQFKRGAAISGDLNIHAGRRAYAAAHARRGGAKPFFAYRFDRGPWDGLEYAVTLAPPSGATHFSEIVYVFDNPQRGNVNWIGPYPSFHALARFVSRSWAAFVHDLDPNGHGLDGQPAWPRYDAERPQNMVLRDGASYVEADTWRAPQLAFWATTWAEVRT